VSSEPNLKIVIIIPARYNSSRLPGKPLIDICGKSMINRTFNRCCQSLSKENIFVATDDLRIYSHCQELNMNVIMTQVLVKLELIEYMRLQKK